MEKSIDSVRRNFNTVRTGRANVSILDRIQARLARAVPCSRCSALRPQAAALRPCLLRIAAPASGAEASHAPLLATA